jgi:hypothetical protein
MAWKAHGSAILRHAALGAACLLVAGCAGLEKPAAPASQPAPIVVAPAPAPAPQSAPAPAPSATAEASPAYGSSKTKRGPLPVRALNVRSDCSFKDETGYNGAMKLRVVSGLVQEFNATVNHARSTAVAASISTGSSQVKDMPSSNSRASLEVHRAHVGTGPAGGGRLQCMQRQLCTGQRPRLPVADTDRQAYNGTVRLKDGKFREWHS